MENYYNLSIWQKGMDIVDEIYKTTAILPKEEKYALADQLRRASISIPSNIAEGYGRNTTKEYLRFLSIARGSKYEIETQLRICVRIGYLTEEQIKKPLFLCNELGKMLNSVITKLNEKIKTSP